MHVGNPRLIKPFGASEIVCLLRGLSKDIKKSLKLRQKIWPVCTAFNSQNVGEQSANQNYVYV
jgi:hypothetical protein